MKRVSRRQFLTYSVCGLTAVGLSSMLKFPYKSFAQATGKVAVNLSIEEAMVEMVDFTPVYHWLFKDMDREGALPSFPGPVIFAFEGDEVTITVTNKNNLGIDHGFRIIAAGPGLTDLDMVPVKFNEKGTLSFTAPGGGTYMYLDPLNAPVNRVMGLHGAFVVLPAAARNFVPGAGSPNVTPYSEPTDMVRQLFNDLGSTPQFPGDPWIPLGLENQMPHSTMHPGLAPFLFRSRIWLFHQVDPVFNELVRMAGGNIGAEAAVRDFLPRYFLINGQSGAFASHAPETKLEAFIGEPHVVRVLNAGLATPCFHTHANHFYPIAVNNVVLNNLPHPDTMTIGKVESDAEGHPAAIPEDGARFLFSGSRIDWVMPFIRPPDIPGDPTVPLRALIPEELLHVEGDVPQSPLKYPMHDHVEQSQTAAGGNYPQGDVTDIIFLGDLDKVPFPKPPEDPRELRDRRRELTRANRAAARAAQRQVRQDARERRRAIRQAERAGR
jgi:hypothetical protein